MSTIKEFLIRVEAYAAISEQSVSTLSSKLSAAEAAEIIVKYLKDNGFLSGYDL